MAKIEIDFENIVEAVSKIIAIGSPKSIHFEMSRTQAKRIERVGKFKAIRNGFPEVGIGIWGKYGIPVVIKPGIKKIKLYAESYTVRELEERSGIKKKKWWQFWVR